MDPNMPQSSSPEDGAPSPLMTVVEPPAFIGKDERRLQVRAYRFWTSLLKGRTVPMLDDFPRDNLPDFGSRSILIDLTAGSARPAIAFLGVDLREEAGFTSSYVTMAQVPPRSLISRLTDRCLQVVASEAPIGFEAEFVNIRGNDTLYRGLLMPFTSDGDLIDYVYGVINWKEVQGSYLDRGGNPALSGATPLLRVRPEKAFWADGPGPGWLVRSQRS